MLAGICSFDDESFGCSNLLTQMFAILQLYSFSAVHWRATICICYNIVHVFV